MRRKRPGLNHASNLEELLKVVDLTQSHRHQHESLKGKGEKTKESASTNEGKASKMIEKRGEDEKAQTSLQPDM